MTLQRKLHFRLGHTRRAFTLLEVLIVVLIIVVLCALVYPVIQRTIASSKKAKCLSNLRSIGVSLAQYASDNNGMLPYKEGQAAHNSPLVLVGALVGTKGVSGYIPWNGNQSTTLWADVFLCPADPNRKLYATTLGYPGSYIYRQNQEAGDVGTGKTPIRTVTKGETQYGYRRWIVMDRGIAGQSGLNRPYPGGSKSLAQPSNRWQPDRISYSAYWHLNGVNVLAEDGSASWRPWGEAASY